MYCALCSALPWFSRAKRHVHRTSLLMEQPTCITIASHTRERSAYHYYVRDQLPSTLQRLVTCSPVQPA